MTSTRIRRSRTKVVDRLLKADFPCVHCFVLPESKSRNTVVVAVRRRWRGMETDVEMGMGDASRALRAHEALSALWLRLPRARAGHQWT